MGSQSTGGLKSNMPGARFDQASQPLKPQGSGTRSPNATLECLDLRHLIHFLRSSW
jgi:hypothetical protein